MQAIRKGVLRDSFNGGYFLNALRQSLSQGCGSQKNKRGGDRDEPIQTHVFAPFSFRA